jgi:hypothetical protein
MEKASVVVGSSVDWKIGEISLQRGAMRTELQNFRTLNFDGRIAPRASEAVRGSQRRFLVTFRDSFNAAPWEKKLHIHGKALN